MVSASTLILLTTGIVANAKLWGWPDDFALVYRHDLDNGKTHFKICEGWGNFCDDSRCQDLDTMEVSPGGMGSIVPTSWKYVNMRKGGSAWLDAWRAEGDTFNMFEQNGDGSVHGQCQIAADDLKKGEQPCNDWVTFAPYLHCWQW